MSKFYRFYRTDGAERNWRTHIAFLLAGKELFAWNSRNNRIGARMATAYTANQIVKFLDDEQIWKSERQRETLIALIKGENK